MTTTTRQAFIRGVGQAMVEARWADVLDDVADDVIAHIPSVGELRGTDALAGFLLETAAKTDHGESFELIDALAGETHAALYFRITATRQGREPLDNYTVHLARLEEGRIAEIWFHNFDGQAVAEFWA